jgi:hypothetical protein
VKIASRIILGFLAAVELVVGLWNQYWPESFYENFPTVSLTPPFSEHYARDFGGATLGIAVVLIAACVVPLPILVITAGLAYTVFAIPHLVFHSTHLDGASSSQAILLTVGNGVAAALGLLVITLGVLRIGRDRRRPLHDPALGRPPRRGDRKPAGGDLRRPVP